MDLLNIDERSFKTYDFLGGRNNYCYSEKNTRDGNPFDDEEMNAFGIFLKQNTKRSCLSGGYGNPPELKVAEEDVDLVKNYIHMHKINEFPWIEQL